MIGSEVYHNLAKILKKKFGGDATLIGDEGGFAPPCDCARASSCVEAIEQAGYGGQVHGRARRRRLGVQGQGLAARRGGVVRPRDVGRGRGEQPVLSARCLMDFYAELIKTFPS